VKVGPVSKPSFNQFGLPIMAEQAITVIEERNKIMGEQGITNKNVIPYN
jgi:hypothetical protein